MIGGVRNGTSTLHLQGRYDDGNASWIVEQVRGLIEADSAVIVLDLAGVIAFEPAAAAALERAGRACQAGGVSLKVVNAGAWLAGSGPGGARRADPPERESKEERNRRLRDAAGET